MVHSLTLLLLGALFATSARADLQLTPKVSESWLDGAKVKFLAFSDGNGKDVTYGPPSGWEYSGSSTRFTLHPPSKPQAEGTIARINLSHPAVFDDETMKKLTAEVLASVPGGSTNVTLVSQEKNLLMIQRKETFLIILSYTFYGQKYGRSILFLNRGNEQIRSQLTCREADFKELHRAFLASQYTWQNL